MDMVHLDIADRELGIGFPFRLTMTHSPLGITQMFELSELLDFHEVRAPEGLEKVRHDLIVDVLSINETETVIEVKPRVDLSYSAIAAEIEALVGVMAARVGGEVRVTQLEWLVGLKGMASDRRSHQKRVL